MTRQCCFFACWTLFWHEWASLKRYGRDIKTVQIYNRRSIILYRFRKRLNCQNGRFWRTYGFCMMFYRNINDPRFFSIQGSSGDHLGIEHGFFSIEKLFFKLLFWFIGLTSWSIFLVKKQEKQQGKVVNAWNNIGKRRNT